MSANGSTDTGENPFSENGYNAEEISLIFMGVCGGIATIIYAFNRLSECNCKICNKLFCIESECKEENK